MKKLTTIIAGFLLIITSAFTPGETMVSANIQSVFANDFTPASAVKWTKYQDIYIASFKEKNTFMTAAYSEEGNLLVVGKYVSLAQLPERAAKILNNKYAGYAISESVIELTTDETHYLVDVQNEKYKLRLKFNESGSVSVESKTKK